MKAILVGSKPNANWQGKLEKNLSTVGIEIVGVWRKPGDPARRGIFAGATGILLTNDCCSHTLQDAAKAEAKKNNLPLIVINHRWSSCSQILAKHGITAQQSAEKAQGESMENPTLNEWLKIVEPILQENPQISAADMAAATKNWGNNHSTRVRAVQKWRKERGYRWDKHLLSFVLPPTEPAEAAEAPPAPSEPAPTPEPTPAPSEPAEAPTEAAEAPAEPAHPATVAPDVADALSLLLGAMRQSGVQTVTLHRNGTADIRVVTVTDISVSVSE